MPIHQACYKILEEIAGTIDRAEIDSTGALLSAIQKAARVFVTGAGRSGLMMRGFAMRLMQLGIDTYVVGETTTPKILDTDILIVGSGSGRTGGPLSHAQIAHNTGVPIFAITVAHESPLNGIASVVIRLPGTAAKVHEKQDLPPSVQPMGSLFEQVLLIYLDAIIIMLMKEMDVQADMLINRHTTLE